MSIRKLVSGIVLATSLCSTSFAGREDVKATVSERGDSVIQIEVVMNVKYGGNDSERRTQGIGFFVDEEGMLLTTLSNIDPGSFYSRHSGQEEQLSTRIKSITYILPNGDEYSAGVVLRDPDLDLAILKPTEEIEEEITPFTMSEGVEAELLDSIYSVSRLGRLGRRTVGIMSGEVQAIIDRPRKMYIPHSEIVTARPGAPVLTDDGDFLGIISMYAIEGGAKSLREGEEPYLVVIVPTADIQPVIDQAADLEPEILDEEDEAEEDEAEGEGEVSEEEQSPEN